jgi:hypothetical protein
VEFMFQDSDLVGGYGAGFTVHNTSFGGVAVYGIRCSCSGFQGLGLGRVTPRASAPVSCSPGRPYTSTWYLSKCLKVVAQ